MTHSLTHLAVRAIPGKGSCPDAQQKCVLQNIAWDANRLLRQCRDKEADLEDEVRGLKYDYYDIMQPAGHHPHFKFDVRDDMDVICLDLYNTYDYMIDFRNQLSAQQLWSKNIVYLDWVIAQCFCCPMQNAEFEELYQMLKGSLFSWSRLKPEFDSSIYTTPERQMHNLVMEYYRLCERSYATLERHQTPAFDKIWEYAKGLEGAIKRLNKCREDTKFYKSVATRASRAAPRYEFRDPEELDITFDANETFESLLLDVAQS
jgi:hypothetical protein